MYLISNQDFISTFINKFSVAIFRKTANENCCTFRKSSVSPITQYQHGTRKQDTFFNEAIFWNRSSTLHKAGPTELYFFVAQQKLISKTQVALI